MKRYRKTVLVIACIVGCGLLFYNLKNSKPHWQNSHTSIENYFISNEKIFNKLYNYFTSIIPDSQTDLITFYNNENEKLYNISVYPLNSAVSDENPILGGNDLTINSTQLNEALLKINWTNDNLFQLKRLLKSTECDWIRTTEINGNPVEIYVTEKNLGSFSYLIFERPLTDSLIEIHGKPIDSNILKNRVVLKYSSAL